MDLGCIDHSYTTAIELGDNWLHKRIKSVSKSLTGIDVLEEDITLFNKKGYNIVKANVENFNLGRTFDTIIAGDIIEHLSNIGLFLDTIRRHMNKDSIFLITTPNPFNIEQSISALFNNKINVNLQHTTWLSPHNLWELALRHDFLITNFFWIDTRFHLKLSRRYILINQLARWVMLKRNICKRDFAVILKISN